jgi:uncharacterized protein (TIGR02569 family)
VSDPARPPVDVLAAFGAKGDPRPLHGGQTTSWAVDGLVLKPDADPDLQAWLGTALARVPRDGFRLADAVPTGDGEWVHAGWSATRRIDGTPPDHEGAPRWSELIQAGRAFHRAIAALPRPEFIDRRSSWWETADRLAWAEEPTAVVPELGALSRRLFAVPPPLGMAQVVHCDLTGNVLFADGRPPGIIDVSPYWRPPAYAEGVVVADALAWHDAPASLPAELGVPIAAVARGLLFRLLTTDRRIASGVGADRLEDERRRYEQAASAVGL